jgi:hypothetical protein
VGPPRAADGLSERKKGVPAGRRFVQSRDFIALYLPPFPALATFNRGLSRESSCMLQARRPGVQSSEYRLAKAWHPWLSRAMQNSLVVGGNGLSSRLVLAIQQPDVAFR